MPAATSTISHASSTKMTALDDRPGKAKSNIAIQLTTTANSPNNVKNLIHGYNQISTVPATSLTKSASTQANAEKKFSPYQPHDTTTSITNAPRAFETPKTLQNTESFAQKIVKNGVTYLLGSDIKNAYLSPKPLLQPMNQHTSNFENKFTNLSAPQQKQIKSAIIIHNLEIDSPAIPKHRLTHATLKNPYISYMCKKLNLEGTTIIDSTLSNKSITKTNLKNAKLENCNLEEAKLSSNTMDALTAKDSNFCLAKIVSSTADSAKFTDCNFINSSHLRVSLKETHFEHCKFNGAILEECEFSDTVFENCKLIDLDFDKTDLSGINLINSPISAKHPIDYSLPPREALAAATARRTAILSLGDNNKEARDQLLASEQNAIEDIPRANLPWPPNEDFWAAPATSLK